VRSPYPAPSSYRIPCPRTAAILCIDLGCEECTGYWKGRFDGQVTYCTHECHKIQKVRKVPYDHCSYMCCANCPEIVNQGGWCLPAPARIISRCWSQRPFGLLGRIRSGTHPGQEHAAPSKGRIHCRRLVSRPNLHLQSRGGPYIVESDRPRRCENFSRPAADGNVGIAKERRFRTFPPHDDYEVILTFLMSPIP
jgi:hypothetical protein